MKTALTVSLVLTLSLLAWSLYHLLDAAAALDDSRTEQTHLQDDISTLRSMLRHSTINMPRAEVTKLLADDMGGNHIVKSFASCLEIDGVTFRFRNDRLVDIHMLNDSSATASEECL